MAKKKEIRELRQTLDQTQSEDVVTAAKAAENDKVRDTVMKDLREKAQSSDYDRLAKENEDLKDRILMLKRRLRERGEDDDVEEMWADAEADTDGTLADTDDTDAGEDLPEDASANTTEPVLVDNTADANAKNPTPVVPAPESAAPKPESTSEPVMSKSAPTPSPEPIPRPVQVTALIPRPAAPRAASMYHQNGPGKAYKYWSYKDRCYKVTQDIWRAQQYGADLWEPVWVWYLDGEIHHLLSEEECERYLP